MASTLKLIDHTAPTQLMCEYHRMDVNTRIRTLRVRESGFVSCEAAFDCVPPPPLYAFSFHPPPFVL